MAQIVWTQREDGSWEGEVGGNVWFVAAYYGVRDYWGLSSTIPAPMGFQTTVHGPEAAKALAPGIIDAFSALLPVLLSEA